MKIDLTELLQQVGNEADLEQEERVSFTEDNLNLVKPIKIKLHLTNTGESVLVNGAVETVAELECTRCLINFETPLGVKIEEEFSKTPPRPKKAKEVDLGPADFVYEINKDNTIDLTEVIRQNLLLAMPIKTLCAPDCSGITEKEGE
ncbi:DUF177 domain-containing protein [Candidatus Margulisiibacteriota bacterium]